MAFTAPRDWTADELVTATIMNTHVRDNQIALKSPPSDSYTWNEGTDLSGLTSTSFADVDATNFALTIVTAGGDVFVWWQLTAIAAAGTLAIFWDIDVDGTRDGGDDGYSKQSIATVPFTHSGFRIITGLSAGAHTFKLQYKLSGGSLTIYRGAGTANADVHGQFGVREMS